jgi:uncharacterized protein
MKIGFTLTLLAFLSFCTIAQTNEENSITFIKKLERQQYDSCHKMFDSVMASQFTANMLEGMWQSIPKYMGEYKGYTTIISEKKDSLDIVLVRCEFEKTKMDLQFAYNSYQKIAGMYFVPPKNTTAYTTPEYAQQNKYYETKLSLKSKDVILPGALCIPNNIKNPPVVLLLAGSGPNDKDESIGPNKILKDLALGLASNGIASYRYDKRTLVSKNEKSAIDINSEVIEDALNAIKMLKKMPDFKNSKIYVVGHSLGAMCAPQIAKKSKAVSGIVLLAGNARPLEDLILEQYFYIFDDDGIDENEQKELDNLKKQIVIIKNSKLLKTAKAEDLPFNVAPIYWESLNNYHQVEVAKKITQPILIIQGERDYQVTMKDFEIWKQNLSSQPKNQFKSYPTLNHLLIKGEGKSLPSEYDQQGNVDEQVVLDLTKWIKNN